MAERIAFLDETLRFPDPGGARADGLLAAGGDLSPERLLLAYRSGIFPWFDAESPILWWSPDPRMVLFPAELRVSASMHRVLKSNRFRITRNTCFDRVISRCARIRRPGQAGTWITAEMEEAYGRLHRLGYAVSYEVWEGSNLAGGLYGVDLGGVFCGESMFSDTPDASKAGFIHMVRVLEARDYRLIDCQVYTRHLASLGAREIPRIDFLKLLEVHQKPGPEK